MTSERRNGGIERQFLIGIDHPSLEGHFPGNPIVPGSVILEHVLAAWGESCGGIPAAKFHRALTPGRVVRVSFAAARAAGRVRFVCRCDDERVCSGELVSRERP
jgi:3-hydroxymyristoyl/3-hydroxydecanoyl-(acyl carrier protein) dehydratase